MNDYNSQVQRNHYQKKYDNLERFVSYHNQKNNIINLVEKLSTSSFNPKILEIGKGNGFLSEYLKFHGLTIKTLDNTKELNPDFLGSITNFEQLPKEKFDIVCCFEVLEHIQFSDVGMALKNLSTLTTNYVLLSVPQWRFYYSFWIKVPLFSSFGAIISVPFPVAHKFDGEHYWELGKRGYGIKKFRNILKQYFVIEKEFTHPLNQYHRFYVLKKHS